MTAPALSGFELMVNALVAKGFKREVAISEVAAQHPELAPSLDAARSAEIRRADIPEKEEQSYVYKLFKAYSLEPWNLSQARETKQAPGLGDAFVTHESQPIAFWWETKRQVGGKLSSHQQRFREHCLRGGVPYHYGDRRDAARLLVQLGLARVGDGPCGIVPFHDGR